MAIQKITPHVAPPAPPPKPKVVHQSPPKVEVEHTPSKNHKVDIKT